MPIYEYRCAKCGEFEEMQRITDPPLERCPKCRRKVTRLISNTSFHLKGSGWYVTDYAGKGKGGDKSSKSETAEKSDSKTESKPEKKESSKKDTSATQAA
jgi:putative FmdB family regulatory protein